MLKDVNVDVSVKFCVVMVAEVVTDGAAGLNV
jgi:hypothetical protein